MVDVCSPPEVETPPEQIDGNGCDPEPTRRKKGVSETTSAMPVEQLDALRNTNDDSDD
jgi:hypothetical protein